MTASTSAGHANESAAAAISRLLEEKRKHLQRLTPAEAAAARIAQPDSVFLIDTRPETYRRAEGAIPDALILERNVLEWRLDPTSPDCIPEATSPSFRPIILCNDGYASSLAASSLQDLGIAGATDLDGGFRRWKRDGLPILEAAPAGADRSRPREG